VGAISGLDWTGMYWTGMDWTGTHCRTNIVYTKLKIYMHARTSTQPMPRPLPLYNQCYTKSNRT